MTAFDTAFTMINEIPIQFFKNELPSFGTCEEKDLREIYANYHLYKTGCSFVADALGGLDGRLDFVPSTLRYKLAASLVDKQARFLFATAPDVVVEGAPEHAEAVDQIEQYVKAVLDDNNFEDALLKAAKDCFIGKRVAAMANFSPLSGVTVTFVPARQFVYQYSIDNPKVLSKFVYFQRVPLAQNEFRIYAKRYVLDDNQNVILDEILYHPNGEVDEVLLEPHVTPLTQIPAVVILNDGLTGDTNGESEIHKLAEYESAYSKLSNADMDSGRFSMNGIRVITDPDPACMKGLKARPGEVWHLATNPNQEQRIPIGVKILESSMNYSEPLKTTLDRIKASAYETVDLPNVSLESMSGVITSGKALKAVYWSMIIRCKEKMQVWAPALRRLIDILVKGGRAFPQTIWQYTDTALPEAPFEVRILQNNSLPDDDAEEQAVDIANVQSQVMSRKAYMQKWRGLTDVQVNDELKQIAYERELLENTYSAPLVPRPSSLETTDT